DARRQVCRNWRRGQFVRDAHNRRRRVGGIPRDGAPIRLRAGAASVETASNDDWEDSMTVSRRTILGGIAGSAAALAAPHVRAQPAGATRVGWIAPPPGAWGSGGRRFRQGIDLYRAERGPRAGGAQVEIIVRDEPGADPPRARQLAQELVVRENVHFLAGGV